MSGEARALAAAVRDGASGLSAELLVCPPFTALAEVAAIVAGTPVGLGAQDCHYEPKGAYTGDISPAMVADAGCRYAILGHSERRTYHAETDALVRRKALSAQAAGLVALICVGETADERREDRTAAVLTAQIEGSVPPASTPADLVVAYEPVWAIGTGLTPTRDQVQEAHAHIRSRLAGVIGAAAASVRLLYGGSVSPANAAELLALPDVDGALVGGASLKADSFLAIARSTP
ncbi:MAG: triose-phosphate isomerase [Alphaproteobacteria bacterium]